MVAGNFNLTNVDELNTKLVERGQHPVFDTDTQAILEETGYHLDGANDKLVQRLKRKESAEKNIPVDWERINLAEIFEKPRLIGMEDMLGWNNRKWRRFCNEGSPGNSPRSYFEDDEVVAVAPKEHPHDRF